MRWPMCSLTRVVHMLTDVRMVPCVEAPPLLEMVHVLTGAGVHCGSAARLS